MSVSVTSGGSGSRGGRKRSLDAELNLVPFIDLLSMCICFLLITAVWIEIGSLQVKQSDGTDGAQMSAKDTEIAVHFKSAQSLTIDVKKNGKTQRTVAVTESTQGDNGHAAFMQKLDNQVRGLVAAGPISAAMLSPAEGVSYGDLVSVMDVLRKNKVTNLGVVPVREKGGV